MIVFPLTFLANAFVPLEGLPDGGLQQVAEWNPGRAVVAAVRDAVRQPDGDAGGARRGRSRTPSSLR